ncbi:MAG: LysM peptidoglycan-binding domain-containing protein [Patescibacteria group bacterium]|nr:LysM peptidoglycan-binding domain-containing protein [Patescibacteria group bacterium]
MPKTNRNSKKQSAPGSVVRSSIFSQVKWGESYTSLFLGIVVVVVAAVLVFSFLKGRNFNRTTSTQSTSTSQEQQISKPLPKTYQVKEGDDLWNISEKIYGSGYNWVDVASENKLANPGLLYVGTKLTIPNVKPRIVKNTVDSVANTQNASSITGSTYTIQKGDYLWVIAVRAYGDGFRWPEIAKANNLTNPDLIHSGNVLKLPR